MVGYLGQNVLVTGTSRGLGLSFVKYILKDYPEVKRLYAGCRNPEQAKELQSLKEQYGDRLRLLKLDVACDESIKEAHSIVEQELQKEGLDLLINNAGIAYWEDLCRFYPYAYQEGNSPMKPSREKIMQIYNVNVAGISVLTATFLTLLEQSTRLNGRPAKVMNLSSHLGSRPFNSGFAANNDFAYAASKAALNMYSHLLAQMKKEELIVLSMAPGHVQTDMGGSDAPLTTDESIPKMLMVLNNAGRERSGEFLDYTGKVLEA